MTDNSIDPDLHESLQHYRDRMEGPMEHLAYAIYGTMNPDNGPFEDDELVVAAIRKINMLKKMLLATGFNERMLKAVMEE
jgi:hypothetical protein